MITLLLSGTHLAVTEAEAAILQPLVVELEELAGSPFMLDPAPCMRSAPAHMLTPARIRARIAERLSPLPSTRAEELERRLLKALTVNGKPFLELEEPRAVTIGRRMGQEAVADWRRRGGA
jgi:hypothetical protein